MKRLLLFIGISAVVVGTLVLCSSISYALDENSCLTCHGNENLTKVNGEGETISLYVSEEPVNTAAHRFIDCTTCHTVDQALSSRKMRDLP